MRQHGQWKNGKCFGNVKLIHVRFNSLRLWAQQTHTQNKRQYTNAKINGRSQIEEDVCHLPDFYSNIDQGKYRSHAQNAFNCVNMCCGSISL